MGGISYILRVKRRQAQRQIVHDFTEAGAVSPESAMSMHALHIHNSEFKHFMSLGVLKCVAGQKYYLDRTALKKFEHDLTVNGLIIGIVGLLLFLLSTVIVVRKH